MASEVDICNLALSRVGDTAIVVAINPPDGSAQARHCSRFYPIARDSILEMHNWGFITRRVSLTPATVPVTTPEWLYAYSPPANYLSVLGVFDPQASDDVVFPIAQYHNASCDSTGTSVITPKNFVLESDNNGNPIIYTNQENATAIVTFRVTDTSKFPPLFVEAFSWLLASYLAGPILKGKEGIEAGQAAMKAFFTMLGQAKTSDANQRRLNPTQSTTAAWMANR